MMTAPKVGIDISHHNPPKHFDWSGLKGEGVAFAIARACYGVASDKLFPVHISAARTAGMHVGAYLFYRQTQGRQEQLDAFVAEMDRVGITDGDIAPTVDLEWNTDYDGRVDAKKFNTDARWIVERLAEKYGQCICYYAPGFFQVLSSPEWLRDHCWWLCHYTSKTAPWVPPGAPDWTIWQHRGGTFRGDDGAVKLLGGRLQGYGHGELDIDVNRARELPLISGYQEEPEHPIPMIEDGGVSVPAETPDTEPAPPLPSPALELARRLRDQSDELVALMETK